MAACASSDQEPAPKNDGKKATFDARNEFSVKVPDGAKKIRLWLAMPQDDPAQKVENFKIEGAPVAHRVEKDSEGNAIAYLEIDDPKEKTYTIVETFRITRWEVKSGADAAKAKPLTDADRSAMARYLGANTHVIIDDKIKKLADEIVGSETNPVIAARKIYDWELANIEYWVKDPKNKKASPVGSTEYCLTNKTGNCTDFHSLWTSIARAKGIPTRMVYGGFFKASLDGQDADQSYHCWPEFYAPGIGWIVHDVAVADIFVGDFTINDDNKKPVTLTTADGYSGADKAKVEYYFGNIDERRVVWSRGRDLTLSPKQVGGPINAMTKAYMEIDGKVSPEKEGWTRKLTFKEIK